MKKTFWHIGGLIGAIACAMLLVTGCGDNKTTTAPLSAERVEEIKSLFPKLKQDSEGYWKLDFDTLSSYPMTPAGAEITHQDNLINEVPKKFYALSGIPVRIDGYMLALNWDSGMVTEFLILRDPNACCYGQMPLQNEWIYVVTDGSGYEEIITEPQTFYGTFEVAQGFSEHVGSGVYRMKCDKIVRE